MNFFPVFFFLGVGENTPGKKPVETQSMKIQAKSGKIPIRKNIEKNNAKRRQWQTYA